jgi:hypothetical protein
VRQRHPRLGVAVAVDLGAAALALLRDRRAGREVHARREVDDLEAVERVARLDGSPVAQSTSLSRLPLVRASVQTLTPSWVTSKAMCGRLGSTLHRVGVADVADERDLLRLGHVGHVDDLEAPAGRALRAEARAAVVAAPAGVGRVDEQLRVAAGDERVGLLLEGVALRRGLDVVLQAGRARRDLRACGRRVRADVRRLDLAALGEPEEVLPAGVRARAERAGRHVRVRALREEVEVGVRVAGGDRRDQLPLRAVSAGVDLG